MGNDLFRELEDDPTDVTLVGELDVSADGFVIAPDGPHAGPRQ